MKNIFILLFCLITINIFSQKMIMLEEATNTSCGPCGASNPQIDAMIAANPDKIVALKYHAWWPGSNDPFYVRNITENKIRINHYQINAVPHIVLNGANTDISSFNQPLVDQLFLPNSSFSLRTFVNINQNNKIMKVTAIIQAVEDINLTSNTSFFLAAAENVVTFNNPPGTNGEKTFKDVFVKFLSHSSGDNLKSDWQANDYQIFRYEWNYSDFTIYNEAELDVRAFIQSQNNTVYQASLGNFNPIPVGSLPFNNDMEAINVSNIKSKTCTPSIAPVITIRNNGNNTLTSAKIIYNVNGEPSLEYEWNGNLPSLEQIEVPLPQINFTLLTSNTFSFTITKVNGNNDDYPKNNSLSVTFLEAVNTVNSIKIVIKTDNSPQETTWSIKNSDGEEIASGGPYEVANKMYTENVTISSAIDCYTFTIYDSGDNGICCSNGNGLYGVENNNGTVIVSGGNFLSSESAQFSANVLNGINNNETISSVLVYPNPSEHICNVEIHTNTAVKSNINITSLTGKIVFYLNNYELSAGKNIIPINIEQLSNGFYFVNVQSNDVIKSLKLNILK